MKFPALLGLLLFFTLNAVAQNLVTYAGNKGDERFNSVVQLSDETYLVGGVADDLNWLPSGTSTIALSATSISNVLHTRNKVGFILHVSKDLKTINRVVYFPAGGVQDIRHIKTDNVPGNATGNIYISGTTIDSRANGGGYFLARLNGNFVSSTPSGLSWVYNVYATGYYQQEQPWDVGSDGKVIFASGQPYGQDSGVVLRLKADGSGLDIVDNWRYHYGVDIITGATTGGHWTPSTGNLYVQPTYSLLLFHTWSRCGLRSWSSADYAASQNDGNGSTRKGKWPLDLFFDRACDTSLPGKSQTVPGYTGYSMGQANTLRVGAITVDRRTNDFYIGASTQAFLPSGLSDEEPFVLAFSKGGTMNWWSRLHEETTANTPYAQRISGLTIDYASAGTMGALVVAASTGGKSAYNLWEGDNVQKNPLNPGYAFHNKYTGTDTTVTISWIGRLRLTNGELLNSTYVAAYNPIDPLLQSAYTEPIHDSWASHNAGNPSLGTTDIGINLRTDFAGRVYMLVKGSRLVTTSNAYQKMVKPSAQPTTAYFLCIFEQDLTKLVYCSALTGVWDKSTGAGGNNTALLGVYPVYNGAIISGYHMDANSDKNSDGNLIPLARIPPWGDSIPNAEEAILARLMLDTVIKAGFMPDMPSGVCTNANVKFTDTSYNATSWSWTFHNGAPATATGKGPHTVKWTTPDTAEVKLVVSDGTNSDSMMMKYIISSKPTASFSYSGNNTSAPDTISFTGPSGAGLKYSWDFGDPGSGGANNSTEKDPIHVYLKAGTYNTTLTVTDGNCSDASSQNIGITGGLGTPDPAFTFTPTVNCRGNEITFSQTSSTNSIQWNWVFGADAVPRTASTKGPHTVKYSTAGAKSVTLTVSNGFEIKSSSQSINVVDPPAADFTYTGTLTTIPATLIFYADKCPNCSYSWDFGDPGSGSSNTASQSDQTHEFRYVGNYWVTLTVTDSTGCSNIINKEIVITSSLSNNFSADFTLSPPGNTCVNSRVSFTDMSRSTSTVRNWYFGSGAVPATSTRKDTVSAYWSTPGIKKVTLVLGGAQPDLQRQKSILYEVTEYPNASFTYSGNTLSAPASVSFDATFKEQGYQYSWDFGDTASGGANTAIGSSPTHTYSATGIYSVTMAVTRNGCTSYFARNVYIGLTEPDIVPAFLIQPTKDGCASPYIKVTDQSAGAISSYAWDFGSDASPTTANTVGPHIVTYSAKGRKTLQLIIGNGIISQKVKAVIQLAF